MLLPTTRRVLLKYLLLRYREIWICWSWRLWGWQRRAWSRTVPTSLRNNGPSSWGPVSLRPCVEPTDNGETDFFSRRVSSSRDLWLKTMFYYSSQPFHLISTGQQLPQPVCARRCSKRCVPSLTAVSQLPSEVSSVGPWTDRGWNESREVEVTCHSKWQNLKDFELRQSRVKYTVSSCGYKSLSSVTCDSGTRQYQSQHGWPWHLPQAWRT